jgi:hypothetical protein
MTMPMIIMITTSRMPVTIMLITVITMCQRILVEYSRLVSR